MRVADEAVGKNVRCPACGVVQAVPASVLPVAVGQGMAQPQVDAAAKVCPMCQTRLDASSVVCITCGFDFRQGQTPVKFPTAAGKKPASNNTAVVWLAGGGIGALLLIVLLLFLLLRPSSAPNTEHTAAQKPPDAKPAPSEASKPTATAKIKTPVTATEKQTPAPQAKPTPISIPAPQIDADAAGAKAIAQYDVNRDGKISSDELYLCPGLNAAIEKLDPKSKCEITAEKITERIKTWQKSKNGRIALTCTVLHNGKPLAGAEVRFVPENFLGEAYQVAMGTTDKNGMAQISIPTTGPDDPPGVPCGFYNVEIAKPGEYIPTKYNYNTILGQEIALDAAGIAEGVKFELQY